MHGSGRSYLLVGVQFACIGAIALTGPLIPPAPEWALVTAAGGLLGVWAVLAMRIPEVSVLPEVRPTARLVIRGPYSVIRHPMYSAVLLGCLGLVMGAPSLLRLALWLALLANLVVKLHYEERLLTHHFHEYAAYKQRTWRIVPYIY